MKNSLFVLQQQVVEKVFYASQDKVVAFLEDVQSPPKLYFFLQYDDLVCSTDNEWNKTLGEYTKLSYFLRHTEQPVKLTVDQDASVTYGEISGDVLHNFERVLSEVGMKILPAFISSFVCKLIPLWGILFITDQLTVIFWKLYSGLPAILEN